MLLITIVDTGKEGFAREILYLDLTGISYFLDVGPVAARSSQQCIRPQRPWLNHLKLNLMVL